MKPAASAQRTGVFPRRVRNVIVRSTTVADVAAPGTTSTSGMMWAGLSQCTTRNRSGIGQMFGRDRGRRGRDDRLGGEMAHESSKGFALEIHGFRQRLLHEAAGLQAGEIRAVLDALERRPDLG